MIIEQFTNFNSDSKNKLKNAIERTDKILTKKYSKLTVSLLFIIELFILYLIYLYEDYGFSVILKLLIAVPVWAIIMITILYFQKRIQANRKNKLYKYLLSQNGYDAFRIVSDECKKYNDGINDYYLFKTGLYENVLIRLQDFNVNMTQFPNNDFIIPPYKILDIVGNDILIEGQLIKANEGDTVIPSLLPDFELFEPGNIMIQNQQLKQ